MKKSLTLLVSTLIISSIAIGQQGFILEWVSGNLKQIELVNASMTTIGVAQTGIGAGDFGQNNVLYAIASFTNDFYTIDPNNASATLLGQLDPPPDQIWTGMAYDDAEGIMYGISCVGTASGDATLSIIDVTNLTYTVVGSQTEANTIACIAIDDSGQMYGINSAANGKLYSIDKTDGSVQYIGSIGVGVAGMGQGLDFCSENQTMYMTNYNSISWANTLRTVNLTNGSTATVGNLSEWTGTIAIGSGSPSGTIFELDLGYQFVSSNIIPDDPEMTQVLSDILNDNLGFVRDSEGNVFRKIGPNWVNGIGDWATEEGYLFKMNSADSFEMFGEVIDPQTPIDLSIGYQFISYFPAGPMDALVSSHV
jgi:hypothetical protein